VLILVLPSAEGCVLRSKVLCLGRALFEAVVLRTLNYLDLRAVRRGGGSYRLWGHPGPGLTLLAMASAASAAVPEDPLRRPQGARLLPFPRTLPRTPHLRFYFSVTLDCHPSAVRTTAKPPFLLTAHLRVNWGPSQCVAPMESAYVFIGPTLAES